MMFPPSVDFLTIGAIPGGSDHALVAHPFDIAGAHAEPVTEDFCGVLAWKRRRSAKENDGKRNSTF
jgi:hypothetical protein